MAVRIRRTRALHTTPRTTRSKPRISYAEDSSSEDAEFIEELEEAGEVDTTASPKRPTRNTRGQVVAADHALSRKRQRISSPKHSTNEEIPKQRKLAKTAKALPSRPKHTEEVIQPFPHGVIPNWQSLPYHIFVQIFQYATYPLYDKHTFQPLPSGRWLLDMARLCRSFAEPAMTVLYTTPPLVPMGRAHGLVDLLQADPKQMAFKYRQKVESLCIDVGQVAAYTLPGSGHLDLYGLIKDLPRLKDLEFYHQKDMSPYRELEESIKWTYPETVFAALDFVDSAADKAWGDKTSICKLKSWRWSSRLAGKQWPLSMIPQIHLKPSFSELQRVTFVNYQIPKFKKEEDDPHHEDILALALKNLKRLEHLVIESSTLANSTLLPKLPRNLRNLELINCWEIFAEDLAEFLLTHGNQLRRLNLSHNLSLNLSFLPTLEAACPNLQVLLINLTIYNIHSFYKDTDPNYDQLLLPSERPTWPSGLQTIEVLHMRKWEIKAAEMFFQSLLDSAVDLRDLRKLSIQAILNIGWRDRATFRDKWVGSLNRVFKRVSEPPQHNSTLSKSADQIRGLTLENPFSPPKSSLNEKESTSRPTTRRNKRVSRSSLDSSSRGSNEHSPEPVNSKDNAPRIRRSTRTRHLQSRPDSYAESSDSGDNIRQDSISAVQIKEQKARGRPGSRELKLLQATAGCDGPDFLHAFKVLPDALKSGPDHNRDVRSNSETGEFIQGMCDIVEVRIDNLRPAETQVTEADFLDEEAPGDSDWDGDKDGDEGYAW